MAEMMPSTSGWKTRPVYTRVAFVGLLLFALVSFVFVVLTLIDGEPSTLVVFVIAIVLSVIFAGLMWWFGRWALALVAVWGSLNLLAWGWLLIRSLSYPNSFFDFVLPLLLTVGALLTAAGAILAFVQLRRGTIRRVSTLAERRTFGAIAVALVALVILSGALHIAGLSAVSTQDEAGAITVELKK